MAGLLGNYAPGLLGGMQDQMPPVPFRQNPVVSAIGAGLLQGPNMAGRYDFSAVGPAIATKGLMQQKAADKQAAEARRLAMNEVIKNYSGLSPEDRAFYMANPDKFDPMALKPKPDVTDDIREYNFAKTQGFPGTFEEWQLSQRKAGADNITVGGGKYGTIPQGYELVEGPDGTSMQPIKGGPAWQEQQAAAAQADARKSGKQVKADVVTTDIDRALSTIERIPEWTTGMGGAALKGIPGSGASNVGALIDTVKANVGFEQLQAMREASPTGGALGAVSERENALLQSVLGSLEQSQSPEQLVYNLKRLKNIYLDIVHGPDNGPPREPLDEAGPATGNGGVVDWRDYFK